MLSIRAATPDELPNVLNVLDEAAVWLKSIGMGAQWGETFSGDPAGVERFQRWIAEGRVFIAHDDDGVTLGCFRLLNEDAHIWGDTSTRCLYLHSLAVRRSQAGQGVAKAMLDWAVQYAASTGAEELRLDCWAGNQKLKRYYGDAGFEFRGDQHIPVEPAGENPHRDYYVAKFAWKV